MIMGCPGQGRDPAIGSRPKTSSNLPKVGHFGIEDRVPTTPSITPQGFLVRVNEWLGLLEASYETILLSVILSPCVVVLHGKTGEGGAVFVDGCFGEFEGE